MLSNVFTRLLWLAIGLTCAGGASAQVVISQVYGGGGNSGATFNQKFVEVFNRGPSSVSLDGVTMQYTSATGTGNFAVHATLSGSLSAGGYRLVAYAAGVNGAALPVSGDVNVPATPAPAAANGKYILANSATALACNGGSTVCSQAQSELILDLVGYGTANFFEGAAAAPVLSATLAAFRAGSGCTDSNQNSADFTAATPSPRNSSTPAAPCSGPPLPEVTFAAGAVSATEGNTGDANPLNFVVNVSPAPQAGSPVTFNVAVTGTAGRFTYGGLSMVTVTNLSVLPLTLSPASVGNTLVDGNSNVSVTLSAFTGTAAAQVSPLAKVGTINDDDVAALPVVSFAAGNVSALEGGTGAANNVSFVVNVAPAPLPGAPVMFNIAATGTAGRFTYTGPASLTVTDTTSLPLTISAQTVGNSLDEADASVTLSLSSFSGTDPSQASPVEKTGEITDDDLPIAEIFDLQGSGVCSPLVNPCNIAVETVGPVVRSANNVITYVGGGGFFIQTPDVRADASALTSNGLFVFASGVVVSDGDQPLAAGDVVDVVGNIVERFGYTQIRVAPARDGNNSILRSATGSALPAAIALGTTIGTEVPSRNPATLTCGASNFECFESMRVSMTNATVAVSNQRFSTDLYAEVYVSPFGERALREKGARFGNTLQAENMAAGIWDGNPEVIEMDADFLIPANNGLELFGAARFSGEGVIGFDFGDYEFWPAALVVDAPSNVFPRPVPIATTDELTIGSFNVFRFCDAVAGNTVSLCSSSAASETDVARVTHQVGQVSAYIRQVLRSPDVVGMQEVENLAILQQLATQIGTDGGPTYSAHLVEGNDVGGIDVGYLVKTARVNAVTVTQLNATEMWLDPDAGGGMAILHDRPPLLLSATFIGNGRPFPFQVINNHTRSRGGVDVSNAAGNRVRAKRYTQGVSIAGIIQGLQTAPATANIPLLVVGDHNAYQFTDAYADVVGLVAGTYVNDENTCAPANAVTNCKLPGGTNIVVPGLVNAVDVLDLSQRYSYNFTENFGAVQGSAGREVATNQVLDHALFNNVAAPFVTGMAFGRGNVDASRQRFRVCNYTQRDLTLCPQGPGTWVATGSSDHDGLVIVLAPPRLVDIFANGFEP